MGKLFRMLLPFLFEVAAKQATNYARSRSAAALPAPQQRQEPAVYVMPRPDGSNERLEAGLRRVEARLEQLDALRKQLDATSADFETRINSLRAEHTQSELRMQRWLLALAVVNGLTLLLVLVLLFR